MIFGPSPGRLFRLGQEDVLLGRAEFADVRVEKDSPASRKAIGQLSSTDLRPGSGKR